MSDVTGDPRATGEEPRRPTSTHAESGADPLQDPRLPDAAPTLPGLAWVLDAERLVELFAGTAFPSGTSAEDVHMSHLRFKPGVSAVLRVDIRCDAGPGGQPFETRWVGTYAPEAAGKVEKARRPSTHGTAAGHEPMLSVRAVPGRAGHVIAAGKPSTDLKLGKLLGAVLADGAEDLGTRRSQAQLLRFNPQRRVVLLTRGTAGRLVTKISVKRTGATAALLDALEAAGAPVLTETRSPWAHGDSRVRCYPWFGDGELSSVSGDAGRLAGRLAGRALADLHAASTQIAIRLATTGESTGGQGTGAALADAQDSQDIDSPIDPGAKMDRIGTDLRALDGAAADRFRVLAARTQELLDEQAPEGAVGAGQGRVLLHGDFSADQVLVDRAALAGLPEPTTPDGGNVHRARPVVITDLDRARLGDPADDLGNLIAADLQDRVLTPTVSAGEPEVVSETVRHVLSGYRARVHGAGSTPPTDRAIRTWAGFHLLARVMAPFRNCSPTWRSEIRRSLDATAWVLPEPDVGRATAEHPSTPVGQGSGLLPTTITSDGETFTVRRAWPKSDGTLTAELTDTRGRIRAASAKPGQNVEPGQEAEPDHPGELHWTVLPYGVDPRLPGLGAAVNQGRLVVHRGGCRAVVELTDRYVKFLPAGKAPAVAGVSEQLHDLGTVAGFRVPRVLATAPDRVELSVLPGRSLHELGLRGRSSDYRSGVREWARRWPSLVRGGVGPAGLPAFTAADEASVLADWVTRLDAFPRVLGTDPPPLRATLESVTEALLDHAVSGAEGVVHRDLHEKQLIVDGRRVGLLDFDTAAVGEPALDLANLSVHLEWHRRQGVLSGDLAAYAQGAIAEVVAELGVDGQRFSAYRASTWLRLGCVYAFRPAWAVLAREWLWGAPA